MTHKNRVTLSFVFLKALHLQFSLELTRAKYCLVTVAQTFRGLQRMQHDTTGKTDLSDELKNIALNKGFIVSDNQGLGNCMFYALSEQLDLVKGIRISHEKLRQTIVQFLKDNPTLVRTD